ncbi:hypothetical protein [Nitritalea halalkaliphila]|uniref:hypothetical protein n=1 Tax=Nitritalea halalkaliphila TaxID=590849 RepID=UPI0012EA89CF|nr:hypothetical protein [Nitritalea halalkaliphila]
MKRSSGPDRERARQAAKALPYAPLLADSVWTFPTHFEQQNPLRQEQLRLELQLPHERPFRMDRSMSRALRQTLYANGYRLRDLQAENVWVFNREGLLCLNCPESHKNSPADSLSRQRHEKAYFMR